MPNVRRREKLNALLREEISKLLDCEEEFPDGTLVTVTRVEISPDGYYATIFTSILGGAVKETWQTLTRNTPRIQHQLNRRLAIRPVPKIRFEIDKQEFRREQVERSLSELKEKKEL